MRLVTAKSWPIASWASLAIIVALGCKSSEKHEAPRPLETLGSNAGGKSTTEPGPSSVQTAGEPSPARADGTCSSETAAADCDDANICTDDLCIDGHCDHRNNVAACATDGIDCTNDVCAQGACTHEPVNPVAISAGGEHTCALMDQGGVRCWGHDQYGQLGDSTVVDKDAPPMVDVLMGAKAVSSGGTHTCALMRSGGVRCWGNNALGQLGNGTKAPRATPPGFDVLSIASLKAFATGAQHTCVLTSGGGVRCWGNNTHGALGDGKLFNRPMPPNQDVAGLPPAHAIVAGDDHTCALLENGGVRCWGFRENGRLGDSETTSEPNRPLPPDFDVLTNVKAIAAGAEHTCALTNDDGGVRCWGRNQFGQLGNDSFDDQTKPTDAVLTDVKAIATGSVHTCALMNDGGVRCWGSNAEGQLGMKTEPPHTVSKPPERDLLGDVKSITAGGTHTCVLGNRGDVRCWGSDHSGSTGSSTPVTRLSHCAP